MRLQTVAAVLALAALLGTVLVVGLGVAPTGGSLEVSWLSDTPRENVRNHHAIGVGPSSDIVVAPIAEVPGEDVAMTNRSCVLARLSPDDGSVVWRTGTPPEACFSHALTEPAIADVDADGDAEVLAASTEEALVAYDGRTGSEEWRVGLSTYGYGRPTVDRVAGGAGVDVVVSDIDGSIVVASGNGTVRWRFDLSAVFDDRINVFDAPVVEDVTGDGEREVLVGTNRGVVALGDEGSVRWKTGGPASHVATVETADGATRVVTAGYESVRAFEGPSGRTVWHRNVTSSRLRVVEDADGDGTPELYLGRVGGAVLALDARSGETEWSTTIAIEDDVIVPPPVTADVTGDGQREVIAAAQSGRVVVLDADRGEELAGYEREVPVWTFVTPADLDGDGDAELLVRYGDGRVAALEYAPGGPLARAGLT